MLIRLLALCSLIGIARFASAQETVFDFFKPQWMRGANLVRQYIRSDAFATMELRNGDIPAVDSIFAMALCVNDADIASAFLSAAIGCFDHKIIYVKTPFTNLPIPLSFEPDSEFTAKWKNLPSHIFHDSPVEGDKDKLQHFFGSAYIEWSTNSHTLASGVGDCIELLEPPLIVGGANDPRDKRANRAGIAFALLLQKYPMLPPSVVLNLVR